MRDGKVMVDRKLNENGDEILTRGVWWKIVWWK